MTERDAIAAAQQRLDREIAPWLDRSRDSGVRIWCARGCGSCCSLVVNTTCPEAAAIAAGLDAGQRQALQSYMERLLEMLPGIADFKAFLRAHRRQLGPCPFLDAGQTCSIYPLRPLSCRALLSTRPADWCAVDFTTLHESEQRAFLASLDPQLVDYPSHYLAAPRRRARELERTLLDGMTERCGFGLGGHLPSLVWLIAEHGLEQALPDGIRAVIARAERAGLGAPWLLQFTEQGDR